MNPMDRRAAVRLAIGAALAHALGAQHAFAHASSAPVQAIAPPDSPMIFRRILDRQLIGAAHLVVTREFAIRFVKLGDGYEVQGNQRSAAVDAPSNIASFARLEEQRVEQGIFPLRLDLSGHILDGETGLRTKEVVTAMQLVARRLGFDRSVPAGEEELASLVRAMHGAGSGIISQLPHDLFAPAAPLLREEERAIALPWGVEGEVHTKFDAVRDQRTGLLQEATRETVTTLAGDSRRTVENWQLVM